MELKEEISEYLNSFDYSAGARACYRCRYYVPDTTTFEDLSCDVDLEDIEGHCCRFPPLTIAQFSVSPIGWCGEWAERNQRPKDSVESPDNVDTEAITPSKRHAIAEEIRAESDSEDGMIYVPTLSTIMSDRSYGPNHVDGERLADLIDS